MKDSNERSKTAEQMLQSKGIQFPASRSPRDYNLTLIVMQEYADQEVARLVPSKVKEEEKPFVERIKEREELKAEVDKLCKLLIQETGKCMKYQQQLEELKP